ncbi:MAG TPA: sn-glycerol-3-phosphate ABC transporter ATP-binding protein UgpC [Candidatus Dormibacteraeota bacterium]|nr:sn-glycerol-3-phosphate ABC transporter ATP-binding protein UgpC [Candidatus Dormibacteraeota bacterium]
MASVTFARVDKIYPDGTRAVSGLDLEVSDGELMVFVGPSGCGKTTVLRMVAGLEEITSGELRIGGQVVNKVEPRQRDVAMVFQNYALYPHMSVFDNIAFPLAARRLPKREIRERVTRTAALLGLEEHLKRRPRNLSGGQRQRVAMGRAIVRQPQVFLMDEPLSNLDAKLRVQMRVEISRLQKQLGVTTIYVTHDQVEAMTMGDRIALLRNGVLQQLGTPQELYNRPANLFAATFLGSPAMNLFQATIRKGGDGLAVDIGSQCIPLPSIAVNGHLSEYVGRRIAVGVRPEHMIEPSAVRAGHPRIRGEVVMVETLGSERLVHLRVAAEPVVTDDLLEVARDVDVATVEALRDEVREGAMVAVARFDADAAVSAGGPQEAAIRPDKIHFFDLETGMAIR